MTGTIESWESSESMYRQYFDIRENEHLQRSWDTYLLSIDVDMIELRLLRRSLQQKIEMFKNIRDGVGITVLPNIR
jgi:hypothetical protein